MVDSLPIHARYEVSSKVRTSSQCSRLQWNESKNRRKSVSKVMPLYILLALVILLFWTSSTTSTGASYIGPLFALKSSATNPSPSSRSSTRTRTDSGNKEKHIHTHIHPPLDYVHHESDSSSSSKEDKPQAAGIGLKEDQPSYSVYRPLVISGPSGVGKRHFLN